MALFKMTIKLLSDLCVSDGGVYNSALDIDVCQDEKGFPVIPGKRLKGCLRESAQELKDWGKDIDPDVLFGKKGPKENAGCLGISDAVLEEAAGFRKEIDTLRPLYHKQNILNLYTYVRTQTAIDRRTGTAAKQTLRTMRVVRKGLEFIAWVEASNKQIKDDDLLEQMNIICANLTHMGNSRTRGLGEVSVSIEKVEGNEDGGCVQAAEWKEGANLLEYELFLEEPMICKSVAGQQEMTYDYIEGSKILGLVAGRYRNKNGEEVVKLLNQGNLYFSNAYIAEGGKRFTEVPAYFYSIKNNDKTYINKLYDPNNEAGEKDGEARQLQQMKHCYVLTDKTGKLKKRTVETEKRYHHRRPEDKSIGRAVGDDPSGDSGFYQIASISGGQRFSGFIMGSLGQIQEVYELLHENSICRMGYGSSSEYGKVSIQSIKASVVEEGKPLGGRKLIIQLLSPAIVYDERATYTNNIDCLVQEALMSMRSDDQTVVPENGTYYIIEQKYAKYSSVGGFNVTWGMRKPVIQAFDKGTSILIDLIDDPQNYRVKEHMFLGERTTEGYGEFEVKLLEETGEVEFSYATDDDGGSVGTVRQKCGIDIGEGKNPLAYRLASVLFIEYMTEKCVKHATKFKEDHYKATVSDMMLMCSENDTYEKVVKAIEKRYEKKDSSVKQKKNKYANDILKKTDKICEGIIKDFEDTYQVKNFEYAGDLKHDILEKLLQQIKYSIRESSFIGKEG